MHARVHIRSKEVYVYVLPSTCIVFDGHKFSEATTNRVQTFLHCHLNSFLISFCFEKRDKTCRSKERLILLVLLVVIFNGRNKMVVVGES